MLAYFMPVLESKYLPQQSPAGAMAGAQFAIPARQSARRASRNPTWQSQIRTKPVSSVTLWNIRELRTPLYVPECPEAKRNPAAPGFTFFPLRSIRCEVDGGGLPRASADRLFAADNSASPISRRCGCRRCGAFSGLGRKPKNKRIADAGHARDNFNDGFLRVGRNTHRRVALGMSAFHCALGCRFCVSDDP